MAAQRNELIDSVLTVSNGDMAMMAFIERIGATLLGVKPAYLISVDSPKCIALCEEHFTGPSSLAYASIKGRERRSQLFIYHIESLKEVLADTETSRYLMRLGYPAEGSVDIYVDLLASKLRSGIFPHEIGIFLGYPLKDVCGFMGTSPIPYRKTMGWRMYGDTRPSEKMYHQFRSARHYVKDMMRSACQSMI